MESSDILSLQVTSLLPLLWTAFGYFTLVILTLTELLGFTWLVVEYRTRLQTLKLRRKQQERKDMQQASLSHTALLERRRLHRMRRLQGPGDNWNEEK